MNTLEAIENRVSRRTFLNTPITNEKIKILQDFIDEYNKDYNLTISFFEDGSSAFNGLLKSYGMFKGVKSVIVLKGSSKEPNLKEKIGYAGERLILEAEKLDLGTCWVGGTFDKKNPLFQISQEEEIVCVVPIGNVASERTFKENLLYKMTHRKTKKLEELYTSDGSVPDWFIAGMRSVQKAPTAINSQKFRFHYNGGKATADIPDTSHFDLVDLGIGKLHFEVAAGGRFQLGNPGEFIKS